MEFGEGLDDGLAALATSAEKKVMPRTAKNSMRRSSVLCLWLSAFMLVGWVWELVFYGFIACGW
jgi:hypothetical protein